MDYILEDENGRALLVIGDTGKFAFSRYVDMNEETKKKMMQMYESLSGKPASDFKRFLNFENDDFQFCS